MEMIYKISHAWGATGILGGGGGDMMEQHGHFVDYSSRTRTPYVQECPD